MMIRAAVLSTLFALSTWAAATLGRHPYLQDMRSDRVTVLWTTTGDPGAGEVRYSADGSFWQTAASSVRTFPPRDTGLPAAFHQHRAELRGLNTGVTYFYRILVDGKDVLPALSADALRFRTPASGRFAFLAFGDSGDGGAIQRAMASRIASESAALVLHTGDVAYDHGTFAQYEDYFFTPYRDALYHWPFFLAPGNHDYYFRSAAGFRAVFAPPFDNVPAEGQGLVYSFDWANVHFTVIDTNEPLQGAALGSDWILRWLDSDLASTRQAWRIAVFHHPPFPTSKHRGDPVCALVEQLIVPILTRHAVHLVLNGHEHNYQRFRPWRDGAFADTGPGTIFVTTGGGGSSTYAPAEDARLAAWAGVPHYVRASVDGAGLTLQALEADSRILDEFALSPAPWLTQKGIRDAAAFGASIAPGGLISLFGWNLAAGDAIATRYPLPDVLGSVRVTLDGEPLPLLYVSRRQINAQVSYGAAGGMTLRIETPLGATESPVAIHETSPAVFWIGEGATRLPAITHADGTLVRLEKPARVGEWITAYLTGLGRVRGTVAAGSPAPVAEALAPVRARAGAMDAEVQYAGLTPGFAGLYQVNLRVPTGVRGPAELSIQAGTATSMPVPLALE